MRALQSDYQKTGPALASGVATTIPPQLLDYFEKASAHRMEAITSFAPKDNVCQPKSMATVPERISTLRKGGLPVSAIADAMRVERKTIYTWLSGGDVRRNTNIQRVTQVHALLTGVSGVDVRGLYRFWNTPVNGGKTLRDLITAENIDEAVTASALKTLRPAALRAMQNEQKMSRRGTGNPALDEIPEAGAST